MLKVCKLTKQLVGSERHKLADALPHHITQLVVVARLLQQCHDRNYCALGRSGLVETVYINANIV